MPLPIPPIPPSIICPSCGSLLAAGPQWELAHVLFHVQTGAVRNGDPCPIDPWAPLVCEIGAPGSEPVRGGILVWTCGHRAVVR